MRTIHVVGAGLAGLAAATALAKDEHVVIYEGSPQAGGRCRSYRDPVLDQTIDNGNHLVLSGNHAVTTYLKRIGAQNALAGPDRARFDFADVRTGRRWAIRPNEGPIAWWVAAPERRVPDTRLGDYLGLLGLIAPGATKRIRDVAACEGPLWERLMRPFLLAALNTEPEDASAALAAAVIRETLVKGGRHYRPRIAHPTLASAFVDPALKHLESKGATVAFGQRLRRIAFDGGRVASLEFPDRAIEIGADDRVILAVPPWAAQELVPDLSAPGEFRAIVNAHFKIAPPAGAPAMLGVIGGTVEWIFTFPDRISITISGADRLLDTDRDALAAALWRDVAAALNIAEPMPTWQIVKERRATFAALPAQDAKRPGTRTRWTNLLLAGDWTATGLPATIEGAIRSGHKAASLL
ncbi:MAG TPA: hydroxysqualene dehydroxylase HpnE [Rhizomicrobium sp.]|nr:hydroxysqualene dehydroxylase HpnE [Rhizomicrobium sp.]